MSNFEFIVASLICLSDESGVPLRQLMESIGPENFEEVATGGFLGSFMDPSEMAYEINRFCGLELTLDKPSRGIDELQKTGETLAKLVDGEKDLYSALTSELVSEISVALGTGGKVALPDPPSPELADRFYTILLRLGRKIGISWATATEDEKETLAEMAQERLCGEGDGKSDE